MNLRKWLVQTIFLQMVLNWNIAPPEEGMFVVNVVIVSFFNAFPSKMTVLMSSNSAVLLMVSLDKSQEKC